MTRKQSALSWWVVVVNYSGVTKPIRCYRPDKYEPNILWDSSGNYDCDKKAGVWPIGEAGGCVEFRTPYKKEADLFYSGASSVGKLMVSMFK